MLRFVPIVVLALVAGFAAGRFTAPPPPSPPKCPDVAPVVKTVTKIEGASCEERLAFTTRMWEAERLIRVGVPAPFPPDLPAVYRPDGFEQAIRDTLAACPSVSLKLDHVDCSEFPCFAWFAQPNGAMNHGGDSLTGCAAWVERYGTGAMSQANSSLVSDDEGTLEYAMLGPHPPDMEWDDNASKRFDVRLEEGRQRLMDAWNARDPTELEAVEADLAFWKAREAEGSEAAARFVENLEARRKRLIEER